MEPKIPTFPTAKVGNTIELSNKLGWLQYWAGYSLNYDDARQLQELISKKNNLNLLLPVDQFPPVGKELIFGLGGNVAEWAIDKQGHGQPLGKNAWMPEDQKTKETPPLNYIGLRVVKEIRVKKEPS